MIWLLLILIKPDESNPVGIVENSLAYYHSCGGNTNMSVAFVFELPTGEDIQYNLNIEEDNQTLPQINNLKFDSNSTVILVFEAIVRSAFNVKTLNNAIALRWKSKAIFDDLLQQNCLWQMKNYKKLPTGRYVFGKDVISSTLQEITMPVVSEEIFLKSNSLFFYNKLNPANFCGDTDSSVCHGDSGSGLIVSGWGVVNTTKILPTKRCHWPAFWLVVCPWYGMHHCQSKI